MSVCCVECGEMEEAWETVRRRGSQQKEAVPPPARGVKVSNRYKELMTSSVEEPTVRDIGGIEVMMPEKTIAGVGTIETLKFAGKGKVTIDSGAAESVMPRGMLDKEPLVEGEAKRLGVRYVAVNGAKMDKYGEKRVRFRKEGLEGINNMLFQVTDVGKPLASVTRILDKGNTVVFSRAVGGSYIVNNASGRKIPLVEEKGTFVMEVEYLEPEKDAQGFTRQGK